LEEIDRYQDLGVEGRTDFKIRFEPIGFKIVVCNHLA